uniref:Putative secreted protein n=1 Tax=Anopheles darlingi TaxID=43151 RepID=A0A2M4DJC6_ANODA
MSNSAFVWMFVLNEIGHVVYADALHCSHRFDLLDMSNTAATEYAQRNHHRGTSFASHRTKSLARLEPTNNS